jgi:hypothetical protein
MIQNCIDIIEYHCTKEELVSLARTLHNAYDPFLFDVKIWSIIERVFPEFLYTKIEKYKYEVVSHEIINHLVMKYYPGECTIKYNLIKKYLMRENEISTFEMKVGNSRLDIGRINGKSYAYEIKTELDTLEKLEKQISDYSLVFDFVYIVIHPKHFSKVKESIPTHCGIITYNLSDEGCKFSFRKKALLNTKIDKFSQLAVLTVKELERIMKDAGEIHIPKTREGKTQCITSILGDKEVNALFKRAIKRRFNKKWIYLQNNFSKIHPIDIQVFFKTQADPYWVYYKNSSIV